MSGIRCSTLMIEPSENCYDICVLSNRCGALKEWERENGKTRKYAIFKRIRRMKWEK